MKQRIFPFLPEIIWKLRRNKYIIPELDYDQWKILFGKRNFYILAQYGGLFENFMVLFFIEWLKQIKPDKLSFIVTNKHFIELFYLFKISTIDKTEPNLIKYSIPVFMDKSDNIYFNYLENYLKVKPFFGALKGYKDYRTISQQILEKFCISNILKYNPFSINNNENKRPLLLIIDTTKLSMHFVNSKNLINIKDVISKNAKSFDIVILTTNPTSYINTLCKIYIFSISKFFELVKQADFIISSEIDYLLISLLISKATIISLSFKGPLNLKRNAKFLKSQNKIVTLKKMSVANILNVIDKFNT